MSQQTRQFFEQIKSGEQQTSFVQSLKEVGGQMWDAAKPMFDHGRTEIAAALFAGHAHVMYMRGEAGIEQGQDQEQVKEQPDVQREQGREM
jgi:hypothetical protein